MSTEAASALMFQNFKKYIKMSSIFNKLATIGQQLYYKRIPVFQGFNHSTDSEAYHNPFKYLRWSVL